MACKDYGGTDESRFTGPMPWVGLYVALASLLCAVGIFMDLFGCIIRSKEPWIPPRKLRLQAATISILAIATKIPSDINGSMPGLGDQLAKLSGVALMCVTMSHAAPSFGDMSESEVVSNLVALGLVVGTLFGNVWIQIHSGVVIDFRVRYGVFSVLMLLVFLLVVFRALTVIQTKRLSEDRYNAKRKLIEDHVYHSHPDAGRLNPVLQALTMEHDELTKCVGKYWLMALTCNPDNPLYASSLIMASTLISSAVGLMCLMMLNQYSFRRYFSLSSGFSFYRHTFSSCYLRSNYKWSVGLIVLIQIFAITGCLCSSLIRSVFYASSHKILIGFSDIGFDRLSVAAASPLQFGGRRWTSKLAVRAAYAVKTPFIVLLYSVNLSCVFLHRKLYEAITFCRRKYGPEIQEANIYLCGLSSIEELKPYAIPPGGMEVDNEHLRIWLKSLQDRYESGISKGGAIERLPDIDISADFITMKGVLPYSGADDEFELPNCWSLTVATLAAITHIVRLQLGLSHQRPQFLAAADDCFSYALLIDHNFPVLGSNKLILAAKMVWDDLNIYNKWMDVDLDVREPFNWGYLEERAMGIMASHGFREGHWTRPLLEQPVKAVAASCMFRICSHIKPHQIRLVSDIHIAFYRVILACVTCLPHAMLKHCASGTLNDREKKVREVTYLLGHSASIIRRVRNAVVNVAELIPEANAEYIDAWLA